MLYVIQQFDRGGSVASAQGGHVDHGLSLPIIHIPNHARRTAIKAAAVRGRVKSNAATDGGCGIDHNGDGVVTESELKCVEWSGQASVLNVCVGGARDPDNKEITRGTWRPPTDGSADMIVDYVKCYERTATGTAP